MYGLEVKHVFEKRKAGIELLHIVIAVQISYCKRM